MPNDPQATWEQYYARIRTRRNAEGRILWEQMQDEGVGDTTVLAIDFSHFSSDPTGIEQLAAQLSENYSVSQEDDARPDYRLLKGTTRPYGVTFSREQFTQWIEFMCDVARSHACVFSTWSAESPELKRSWTNKHLEPDDG